MIEEITSIDKKSLIQGSPDQLFRRTHPDDIQQMLSFSNHWAGFLINLPPERRSHVHPIIFIHIKNKEEISNHWSRPAGLFPKLLFVKWKSFNF